MDDAADQRMSGWIRITADTDGRTGRMKKISEWMDESESQQTDGWTRWMDWMDEKDP